MTKTHYLHPPQNGVDAGPAQIISLNDNTAAQLARKSPSFGVDNNISSKLKPPAIIDDPPTPLQTMATIPEGSAWCSGSTKEDRTCRFKNLCYNPKHEDWFIIKTNRSILEGVPTDT